MSRELGVEGDRNGCQIVGSGHKITGFSRFRSVLSTTSIIKVFLALNIFSY